MTAYNENWLTDVTNFIRTANLAGVGDNVFLYDMAQDIKQGVLVIPPATGMPVDREVPGYFKGQFEVMSRSPHPQTANDIAGAIFTLLKLPTQALSVNCRINYCDPINLPQIFPKSEAGLYEAMVTFMISFVDLRI